MSVVEDNAERKRAVLREVLDALMSGKMGVVARHFAPGLVFSNRSNAGIIDAPWFDRLEGDFRLAGEEEARTFLTELMRRAKYISHEERGLVIEDEAAASLYNWTRRDERDGTLVTGTTMYWVNFTSDTRIRYVETISSIHSVFPVKGAREGRRVTAVFESVDDGGRDRANDADRMTSPMGFDNL